MAEEARREGRRGLTKGTWETAPTEHSATRVCRARETDRFCEATGSARKGSVEGVAPSGAERAGRAHRARQSPTAAAHTPRRSAPPARRLSSRAGLAAARINGSPSSASPAGQRRPSGNRSAGRPQPRPCAEKAFKSSVEQSSQDQSLDATRRRPAGERVAWLSVAPSS